MATNQTIKQLTVVAYGILDIDIPVSDTICIMFVNLNLVISVFSVEILVLLTQPIRLLSYCIFNYKTAVHKIQKNKILQKQYKTLDIHSDKFV